LQFLDGQDAQALGLDGTETFDISAIAHNLVPGRLITVRATRDNQEKSFQVRLRIDTPNEVDYYKNGGILPFVLRQLIAAK
jgi:aconitate hydratase